MDKLNYVEIFLMLVVSGFILVWSFFGGLDLIGVTFDLYFIAVEAVILDAAYSSIIFSTIILVSTSLLTFEIYSRKDIPLVSGGPKVAALVPVYEDAEVLDECITSLNRSNYNNLEIYAVCEPGDEGTIEVAESLDCNVILNSKPGSNASAINTSIMRMEADYYAIFDADEIVDPDFISQGVGYLEEGYEAFQGRRIPIPDGFTEKFAYCERALYHSFYQLMELTGFHFVKSSSTIITEEVLDEVGGYDDMLTEDIDFTYKCYQYNINAKSDRRITNMMEAPHNFKDFWGQRKRWSIGLIQVMHKFLKRDYQSKNTFREVYATLRAILAVFGPIFAIGLLSKLLILFLLGFEILYVVPVLLTAFPTIIISLKDREKVKFIGFYSLMTFFTAVAAAFLRLNTLFEYVLSWDGEWFTVKKRGNLTA